MQQIGRAVTERIQGLWTGLQSRFTQVLGSLEAAARAAYDRLQSAARSASERLASAWAALRDRASELSQGFGRVVGAIVDTLLSWRRRIWSGIQDQWAALQDCVRAAVSSLGEGFNVTVSVWTPPPVTPFARASRRARRPS